MGVLYWLIRGRIQEMMCDNAITSTPRLIRHKVTQPRSQHSHLADPSILIYIDGPLRLFPRFVRPEHSYSKPRRQMTFQNPCCRAGKRSRVQMQIEMLSIRLSTWLGFGG